MGIPTPVRIESFDNSNIMGTSPVSAMVVFENGKPNKKEYRKYKIKTVEGPDDYAACVRSFVVAIVVSNEMV